MHRCSQCLRIGIILSIGFIYEYTIVPGLDCTVCAIVIALGFLDNGGIGNRFGVVMVAGGTCQFDEPLFEVRHAG